MEYKHKVNELTHSISLIFVSYILIYFNLFIGTLDVLPDWLGYAIILRTIVTLSKETTEVKLLRPLLNFLILWNLIQWGFTTFGMDYNMYMLEIIASVITLYFHFQFLTNIALIAEKYNCNESRKILHLRTGITLFATLFSLPFDWTTNNIVLIIFMVMHFVIIVWLWITLSRFKRSLIRGARIV